MLWLQPHFINIRSVLLQQISVQQQRHLVAMSWLKNAVTKVGEKAEAFDDFGFQVLEAVRTACQYLAAA